MEKLKTIVCLVDKIGRIQYYRLRHLANLIQDVNFRIYEKKDKISEKNIDALYFSHFSLYDQKKYKKFKNFKKMCSITSHKCLLNKKSTIEKLGVFDSVSVNNLFLFNEFKESVKNLYYTPNGVDTLKFPFKQKKKGETILIGWVGNADRDVKNYKNILLKLQKKYTDINFVFLATSKSDKKSDILPHEKMKNFYHDLDFYIVVSKNEGTPNPALESLSCGVPVITTYVGNMPEIIKDGYNGFFIDCSFSSAISCLKKVKDIDSECYSILRNNARKSILEWDWNIKYKNWKKFFKSVL